MNRASADPAYFKQILQLPRHPSSRAPATGVLQLLSRRSEKELRLRTIETAADQMRSLPGVEILQGHLAQAERARNFRPDKPWDQTVKAPQKAGFPGTRRTQDPDGFSLSDLQGRTIKEPMAMPRHPEPQFPEAQTLPVHFPTGRKRGRHTGASTGIRRWKKEKESNGNLGWEDQLTRPAAPSFFRAKSRILSKLSASRQRCSRRWKISRARSKFPTP